MDKPPLAHILIVEDDSELLEVFQFVLEDGGYKVSVATTGAGALEIAGWEPIDLLVLDVDLDGTSGLDVARQLRAGASENRLPIALHTGLAEVVVRKDFTDYDLFIPKGDDANLILDSVAKLLARPTEGAAPVQALHHH